MKLRLLKDILAVRVIEQKLSSTIIFETELSMHQGEVVNIGKDVRDVEVGDVVYFSHRVGQGFMHDGEELLAMHESEVMGLVKKEDL